MTVSQGRGRWSVNRARVARIIAYLIANQDRLAEMPKGQLTFSFAGETGLTAEVVEKQDLSQVH
jgi:hypothetical protein